MNLFGLQGGNRTKRCESVQRVSPSFKRNAAAFTLTEVAISLAILALVFNGILKAYTMACQRSEWSAHSLAAQSLAVQHVEARRAAQWDPQTYPVVDEGGLVNFRTNDILDIASSKTTIYATSVVSVTTVSLNPPLRQIRADCIWSFPPRGLFTNTVVTLRAPDQ